MSGHQDNPSFPVEKALSTYTILALVMCALILGAGWVQYNVALQQKSLTQVTSFAQHQLALTQRITAALTLYQATNDSQYIKILKETATAALAGHEAIAPLMTATLPQDAKYSEGRAAIRALIDEAFTFAVTPDSPATQARLPVMLRRGMHDIPQAWGAEVQAYNALRQQNIDTQNNIMLGLCGAMLLVFGYGAFLLALPAMQHAIRQRAYLERVAATDLLTGTYTRATMFKVAAMLISSGRRHKQTISVLAVDIDGLKEINDKKGRAAGDGAVRAVAKAMSAHLRNSDVIGRCGGGEFAIFLPSTDEYHANYVAEKLRGAVEEMPCAVKQETILLRVSIGIATLMDHHSTPDDMLRSAEVALQHAKETGRNRVVTWGALHNNTTEA